MSLSNALHALPYPPQGFKSAGWAAWRTGAENDQTEKAVSGNICAYITTLGGVGERARISALKAHIARESVLVCACTYVVCTQCPEGG